MVMRPLLAVRRGTSKLSYRLQNLSLFWRICFCMLLSVLGAFLALRSISTRDPGSLFFQPNTAYERKYSIVRQQQAQEYIERASADHFVTPENLRSNQDKQLCVGIPSVGRQGTRYLRATVGSLLEGLSPEERNLVSIVVFIAHSDPITNPEYQEAWLSRTVDKVLLYEPSQLEHIVALEQDIGNREKMLFDYTYALKACIDSGTPYIAMLEDDVLASEGWLWRTMLGLQQIDDTITRSSELKDYLYMRLFYTEELFGWNSESWPTYLFWSLMFTILVVGTMFAIRTSSTVVKKSAIAPKLLILVAIFLPLMILLFFAAGKSTVLPLTEGINAMNQYGCCSQGLVFPRAKAQDIAHLFEERKIGFVDMLIEEYADAHAEFRWALTPPVLQHIGRKSSKGDDFGEASKNDMPIAAKLWNFQYELNDAEELRREHEIVSGIKRLGKIPA